MAQQTKTKRSSSSSAKSGSKPRSAKRPASRAKSNTSRNGSSSTKRTTRSGKPQAKASSKSPVATVADTAKDGAKTAGGAVKDAAKGAKVPAMLAGAGIVGLAGGIAAASRGSRKRVLGVAMPRKSTSKAVTKNLAEASRNVGRFGEGMGSLAAQVNRVSEGVAAANGTSRRSPVEVVLQGLTRRR